MIRPADRVDAAVAAGVAELMVRSGWDGAEHSIKGDAGAVVVVGGSVRYLGPPLLAVRAAARTGVDDVRAILPESGSAYPLQLDVHLHRGGRDELDPDVVAGAVDSLMDELLPHSPPGQPGRVVLLVGPGMGGHPDPQPVLDALTAARRRLGPTALVVVDGHLGGGQLGEDRMQALAPDLVLLSHREAVGLLADADTPTLTAAADRLDTVLLVKGASDRITSPGAALVTRPRLDTAVQELTKSGTGDVLAGTVAGLLARGLSTSDAAELGCWLIHAASHTARAAHGPGFLPSELADHLSTALLVGEGHP